VRRGERGSAAEKHDEAGAEARADVIDGERAAPLLRVRGAAKARVERE
jgi:hypothetical protein